MQKFRQRIAEALGRGSKAKNKLGDDGDKSKLENTAHKTTAVDSPGQVRPKDEVQNTEIKEISEEQTIDDNDFIAVIGDSRVLAVAAPAKEGELPSLKVVHSKRSPQDGRLSAPFGSSPDSATKIEVVVSTLSGTQQATSYFDTLLSKVLQELGFHGHYNITYTKDANTVVEITQHRFLSAANAGQRQLIVLLSGDGGVVDVLNTLASARREPAYIPPEIALLPMGTGNALANSTGANADNTLGLATLARGVPRSLPTFRATFSPGARLLVDEARGTEELPQSANGAPYMLGAVVCSWGLHAGLVADSDTEEYRKHGVDRFKLAAQQALYPADGQGPHRYRANMSLLAKGEREWRRLQRQEHAYVLTTLVSSLEKGFTISPASKPLEGALRIVHFGPMSGDAAMEIMGEAYKGGKHVENEAVSYEEVDGVRIAFDGLEEDGQWRRICLDGKIVRVEADGWVEIKREPQTLLQLRHLERS